MKITIEIDTANAAFGDTPEEVGAEAGRILRDLSESLKDNALAGCEDWPLRDVNGNRVGFLRSTEWDHEADEED